MKQIYNHEQIARTEMQGTDYKGELIFKENTKKPHFEAKTSLLNKNIEIGYNPEYEEQGKNPTNALRDIPRHEMNHHGYNRTNPQTGARNVFYGCPRTADLGRKNVFEHIYEVLKGKGFSQGDALYLENTLEDSLLHADLSKAHNLDGITDFFEDVALANDGKFGDFYDAHVKLNMFLWGSKRQKGQVGKYLSNSPQVREVIKNFIQRTGIADMKETSSHDANKVKDKKGIRRFLMDETNWPTISRIYAEEFSKLMTPSYALPVLNHSGAGTKGRESEDAFEQGNILQQEAQGEDYQRERVQEVYQDSTELPNWMTDTIEHKTSALHLLYQSLARKLDIKAETNTQTLGMPIVHFGNREFDPLMDDPNRIRLAQNLEGKLEWQKKRFKIETPIEVKISSKGFPSVRYCMIDSSRSMLENPEGEMDSGKTNTIPWGDNSKYHYALLGWVGFLEYLKANHLLVPDAVELYSFSTQTVHSKGLRNAVQKAFNPSFGGSTNIDKSKAEKIFEGRDNLIFTISDGEIQNWDDLRDVIIDGALRNNYFHLQIGKQSHASKDMKKNGVLVVPVLRYSDLAQTTIDLTRNFRRKK